MPMEHKRSTQKLERVRGPLSKAKAEVENMERRLAKLQSDLCEDGESPSVSREELAEMVPKATQSLQPLEHLQGPRPPRSRDGALRGRAARAGRRLAPRIRQ